jgi:hypothetical protein
MATRKTGNELFDIFWQQYPARTNSAGVSEKKRKGPALKWFEKNKPAEELVYDMVVWLKKDIGLRAKSETSSAFYPAAPDAVVWLNQSRWMDEIGEVVTTTQRREVKRSKAVYGNNINSLIDQYKGIVNTWTVAELRANPGFIKAYNTYPEFRAWVQKQLPDRTPPEPHPPINLALDRASGCEEGILTGTKTKGHPQLCRPATVTLLRPDKGLPDTVLGSQISPDGDLPPPCRIDKFNARLKAVRRHRDKNPVFI